MGGIFHLKLNIGERPIANKYREGKMKRTLKRELKVREIAKREAFGTSVALGKSTVWVTGRCTFLNCRSTSVIDIFCGKMIGEGSCHFGVSVIAPIHAMIMTEDSNVGFRAGHIDYCWRSIAVTACRSVVPTDNS